MDAKRVDNLQTIKGKYLAIEIKEGFDDFNLGDTDIRIHMPTRTGVAKYTNFSQHCQLVGIYPESTLPVGTHFWTRHEIVDDHFEGKYLHHDLSGKKVFALREENILFVGEDITKASRAPKGEPWVLVKTKGMEREQVGNLEVVRGARNDIGTIVNGVGILSEGDVVTWIPGGRVEYWQKEVQYWGINITRITSVNGKPHGEYYHLDLFDDFEMEQNGLVLRGRKAAAIKYGITPRKHHHIAILNNPELEHHGKTAIVKQSRKVPYSDEVVMILD